MIHESPARKAELQNLREEHTRETRKLTQLLIEAQKKLKHLVKDVLNPVMKDVDLKDTIIAKQVQDSYKAAEDLRILNAIIRLPNMCQEYHAAWRRKLKQDQ